MVFIFLLVTKFRIKLNFTQNIAVSFAFCVNSMARNLNELVVELKESYEIEFLENMELITVRHYNFTTIEEIQQKYQVVVERKNKNTAVYLIESDGRGMKLINDFALANML